MSRNVPTVSRPTATPTLFSLHASRRRPGYPVDVLVLRMYLLIVDRVDVSAPYLRTK